MRDPNRLDNFYKVLHDVHKEVFSDWRFGQLMSNFLGWCVDTKRCFDIFFPEDDKWELWIKEYANEFSQWKHYDV